jgi:hypothetical protein
VRRSVAWIVAFVVGTPVLGVGIPLAWLWVASQLQGGTRGLGFVPLIVLVVGMLSTYLLVTTVAHWINPTPPDRRSRVRNSWLEPMARDRTPTTTTSVEGVFVACTMAIATGMFIYLLLFGHPSLPLGT